jgi:D-glycero-D-manno-heptose 1,7-bisphosphate phosphatase
MDEHDISNFPNIEYVFLDRDGVLNRGLPDGGFVTRWEEFELLPGIADAIAKLNRLGRKVIVVTNQRCVALGLCTEAEVHGLHELLRHRLNREGAGLDAIYFCPHDVGKCNCRKPLPGLFEQAFRDFPGANAGNSVMIGDSLSDIEAGSRLRMRTIFIDSKSTENNRSPDADRARALASAVAESLPDCVERYLSRGDASSQRLK